MIELLLIGIFSILACWLFEKIQIRNTVDKLVTSYKKQYQLIVDSSIEDEVKQQQLLKNIAYQLQHLGALIFKIVVLVSPFLLFYLLEFLGLNLNTGKLLEWDGIVVSLISILLFLLIKNSYVKVFQNK